MTLEQARRNLQLHRMALVADATVLETRAQWLRSQDNGGAETYARQAAHNREIAMSITVVLDGESR